MFVHNLDPILINFGIISLRWYSLAYIFGILIGLAYGKFLIKKYYSQEKFSINHLDDFLIWIISGIIIGGRVGYIIFYNPQFFIENPSEIIKIWTGGMSFHGGMVGLIVAAYIFSKKQNFSFWLLSDILACVAPIGLFLGRIANFINSELVGKPTDQSWSVIFPLYDNIPRHPSQIYEAILEGLILFLIINLIFKKKKIRNGIVSFIFIFLYSIFRICAEFFREPDQHIGYIFPGISLGTLLCIITILISIPILIKVFQNDFRKNY